MYGTGSPVCMYHQSMNSPVAQESMREASDFTSAMSVVLILTLSLRELGPSSTEAIMNLVGRHLSHFWWKGLGRVDDGSTTELCTTSMGSTVLFMYVDRIGNQL